MTEIRTALVTNAADFAGPGAVLGLLEAGWRVLAHDRSFSDPEAWNAFHEGREGLTHLVGDDMEVVVDEAFTRAGHLHALVSNDHYPAKLAASETLPVEALRANLEYLIIDPFKVVGSAAPRFKAQGGGNIVMITSNRMRLPQIGGAIPDAARAGQNALVESFAREFAADGIAVNAIAPNFLYSEAYYPKAVFEQTEAGRQYVRENVPVGRLGEPAEMGELVAFLAGASSRFMTGAIIDWSGGWPTGAPRPS